MTTPPKPRNNTINSTISGLPKDYRKLVNAALRQGWTLTVSRSGHPKLTAPDGRATPVPSSSRTPQMFRGWANRLRKMGLDPDA